MIPKHLAVVLPVLMVIFGSAGLGESLVRIIMDRAHIQAVASTGALAVVKYHQRRVTTTLDDLGASAGAPKEMSVEGADGLDLSVSTIFEPDRYDYAIGAPATFHGAAVSVVTFRPLAAESQMLASVHADVRNKVINNVINHLEGRVFIEGVSGAIVRFEAHLATAPLGFALGQVYQADVSCEQIQVGTSWFPSRVVTTFRYQLRDWRRLFLAFSEVHQHVVVSFVY